MELLRYLNDRFFTEAQLLAAAGVDAATLADWQRRALMPLPSYRLALALRCDSYFGEQRERHHLDYYAKGYVEWLHTLRALDGDRQARVIFSRRYTARLAQLRDDGLDSDDDKLGAGLAVHLAQEWRHFLDGIYGLCTNTGLPEAIADKELAMLIIRQLDQAGAHGGLEAAALQRLGRAVDLLDAASSPFAPHELARSSRRRLVDDMRARWDLPAGRAQARQH